VVQTKLSDPSIVKGRIERARDEILYIQTQIAELKGRNPPRRSRAKQSGRGRPRSPARLEEDLRELEAMLAYLHAEWVKLRGEPVFSGALGDLEKLRIVVAPRKPVVRKQGRPSKPIKGNLIRFWVDLILARDAHQGKKTSVSEAGKEAQPIIHQILKKQGKAYNKFYEQDYYAEKRRIPKIRQPLKTRMK